MLFKIFLGDASDEPRNCTFRPCATNEFSCGNSKCIRISYKCDVCISFFKVKTT